MKFYVFFTLATISLLVFSCGQATKTDEKNVESYCDMENDFYLTIRDYYHSMSDTLVVDNYKFEVKQSKFDWINDSTVSLKLKNYTSDEFIGQHQENQFDVIIEINARKGKKLTEGFYAYHDYESGLWSRVTIITVYGSVWFNWLFGMPKQGGVNIEHISKDAICGTLNLNVEDPSNSIIGIVKLNGDFSYKK